MSLYLSTPEASNNFDSDISRVREMLSDDKDELEHFEENLNLMRNHLEETPFKEGSLCMFACWATNYLHVVNPKPGVEDTSPDLPWVDSSSYIRPLAELQDEYENYGVVTADNTDTRVFFVTSDTSSEEERVKGDI